MPGKPQDEDRNILWCTVADPGGAMWGNFPPKRLWRPHEWRPFAINAPPLGAQGTKDRYLKNTRKWTMFFAWLTVKIYVLYFTQPIIEWRKQCYCFVIPLFRYFFAAWELPSLTLCCYKRSCFRLTQFSTRRWASGVTRLDGARCKFGAPMFETEVFQKLMHCIEESTCDIVWTFRRSPQWFGARGNVSPCPPLYGSALGCTQLVYFLQVYFL